MRCLKEMGRRRRRRRRRRRGTTSSMCSVDVSKLK
jgi:hypothetical protein